MAIGILGIILMFAMLLSTLVNVLGANYMNPDKKANWTEVCWGVAGALAAYFSFLEISRLDQHHARHKVKKTA